MKLEKLKLHTHLAFSVHSEQAVPELTAWIGQATVGSTATEFPGFLSAAPLTELVTVCNVPANITFRALRSPASGFIACRDQGCSPFVLAGDDFSSAATVLSIKDVDATEVGDDLFWLGGSLAFSPKTLEILIVRSGRVGLTDNKSVKPPTLEAAPLIDATESLSRETVIPADLPPASAVTVATQLPVVQKLISIRVGGIGRNQVGIEANFILNGEELCLKCGDSWGAASCGKIAFDALFDGLKCFGFALSSDGVIHWPGGVHCLGALESLDLPWQWDSVVTGFRAKTVIDVQRDGAGFLLTASLLLSDVVLSNTQFFSFDLRNTQEFTLKISDKIRLAVRISPVVGAFLCAINSFVEDGGDNILVLRKDADRILAVYSHLSTSEIEVVGMDSVCSPEDCPSVDVHPAFCGSLRDYQELPHRWMLYLYNRGLGGILADDMRLGKTVVSAAVLLQAHATNGGISLILCPHDLLDNWRDKLAVFAPTLRIAMFVGDDDGFSTALKLINAKEVDVVIASTSTAKRNDFESLSECYDWNLLLVDEAQDLKNAKSRSFARVLGIKARARFALTGTPVENRPMDLWALLNQCIPGGFVAQRYFSRHFDTPISEGEVAPAAELRGLSNPFMIRRRRVEVQPNFVAAEETIHYCEMGPNQTAYYNAEVQRYRATVVRSALERANGEKILVKDGFAVLSALTVLRRGCDDHRIDTRMTDNEIPIKYLKVVEILKENPGKKFLIFSNWVAPLANLSKELRKAGFVFDTMSGVVPRKKRGNIVRDFQGGNLDCLMLSMKTGGRGLDLHAADQVIILDPWWNPFTEMQASARAEDVEKLQAIKVHRLICSNTIELGVLGLQEHKLDMVNALLGAGSSIRPRITVSMVNDLFPSARIGAGRPTN